MKKIKIHSVLSNFENETTNVEALADYDEKENTIVYTEEELRVKITILKNKVIMNRKSEDYNLNLEFVENQTIKCKYEVKSVGLNIDVDVFTKLLEIESNIIYVNYQLFNDGKPIGTFEYKLMFKE